MTKTCPRIGAIGTLLALTGCATGGRLHAHDDSGSKVSITTFAVDSKPILPCALRQVKEGRNGNVAYVIRVRINANLDINNQSRNVKWYVQDAISESDEMDADENGHSTNGSSDEQDNNPVSGTIRDPFHIYISPFYDSSIRGARYVKVRVVLENNNNYSFTNVNSHAGNIDSIGVSDDDTAYICSIRNPSTESLPHTQTYTDINTGRNVVVKTFFIRIGTPGLPINYMNIIMKPNSYSETPIIIDPKIQNRG